MTVLAVVSSSLPSSDVVCPVFFSKLSHKEIILGRVSPGAPPSAPSDATAFSAYSACHDGQS